VAVADKESAQAESADAAPAESADAEAAESEVPAPGDAAAAEAGAGSKRSADSKDGEALSSPDRPKKQKKSGWDSQETLAESPGRRSTTPGKAKAADGPPPREGDWVSSHARSPCFCSRCAQ
jgi:hypothetical protein